MDIRQVPNPYDFANPVRDADLFVGRRAEMDDIRYYLDHAKNSDQAISLALMGDRASGKTFFLNIIEAEAEALELLPVRVTLDEGDVETELAFFYKLFDCLLTAACQEGAFAGVDGRVYETYRDTVDALELPSEAEKEFCPFVFPTQFARAQGAGNRKASLSATALERDLSAILKELGRPIVILFDECDVLAKSRVHLEKLRNVFMNISGFMIVMTGTPALFPLMDDVFSPIVRQFKRIKVEPFDKERQTRACVAQPLERMAQEHGTELRKVLEDLDMEEIHAFSGGRPYEIKLMCHFMFKRIHDGLAKAMQLDLSVLDDVLSELEAARDVSTRPILRAVRLFDDKQFGALRILCGANGHATLDQLWYIEYVSSGADDWTREEIEAHLADFEAKGIVSREDEIISFQGDEFDRIYCKYLAKQKGVYLDIRGVPVQIIASVNVEHPLHSLPARSLPLIGDPSRDRPGLADVTPMFLKDGTENPLEKQPAVAEEVYWSSVLFRSVEAYPLATLALTTPWFSVSRYFVPHSPSEEDFEAFRGIEETLGDQARRAQELGGNIAIEVVDVPVVPGSALEVKVAATSNLRLKRMLAIRHVEYVHEGYPGSVDIQDAILHYGYACELTEQLISAGDEVVKPEDVAPFMNNLGYLNLVAGRPSEAQKWLAKAKELGDPETNALAEFNLGVAYALDEKHQDAERQFRLAAEIAGRDKLHERSMAFLMVPEADENGALVYVERVDQDVLVAAEKALLLMRNKPEK